MDATPEKIDLQFKELEPRHRVYRFGAWNLRGPGIYVQDLAERIVIGHRPGAFHYAIAVVFSTIAVAIVIFVLRVVPELWWLAAIFGFLFGVVPILPLLNTQRFEIDGGTVRMRGRAMGFSIRRDYSIPPDGAVRVEEHPYCDDGNHHWRCYQAQIKTDQGWLAIAELLHDPEPVREFAAKLSAATKLPLHEDH